MALTLISPAFEEGAEIPLRYTCDGEDVSSEFRWCDAPVGIHSYALIAHDPDSPKGDFTHWLLYDIKPVIEKLPESNGDSEGTPGRNDFGNIGYGGPCPNQGEHRYLFDLYALDIPTLDLRQGATRAEVEAALQGHIRGQTTLMGGYQRRKEAQR